MPTLPSLPESMPEPLRPLVEEVDRRQQAFDVMWPNVMELRRRYFTENTEAAKGAMEAAIEIAQKGRADLDAAIASMFAGSGIDPDDLDAENEEPVGDPFPRISRVSIISGAPPASAFVEDHLPQAIEMIEPHARVGWLALSRPTCSACPNRRMGVPYRS